ncbi:MAG: hypothetical protein O3A51_13940 [Verrucomicrobia bacterium]|nr:hypothetical protein [Verrucomicrobiota bacterium]
MIAKAKPANGAPDFKHLSTTPRSFAMDARPLIGQIPTIAITPVADGRAGAYEANAEASWQLVEKVYKLITSQVCLPDGTPVRVVVPPEIVYGPRSAAVAQAYYATQGVCANIWVSRCWAYSDELMGAALGIGSSEWQQAAYGLNQTDRPGAVWLKAFCAAMDEKKRPIFQIYNPDLEDESKPLTPFVADRLVRFARCAAAVGEMRGKNYLSIGSVSMGIIGSDLRRNNLQHTFGMGSVSYDMAGILGRLKTGFYDHEEVERAMRFMKTFKIDFGSGKRPQKPDDLLRQCIAVTLIVRDLMTGNPRLADKSVGKKQGFRADIELAQGNNAIAAGTQGQRQWTDYNPNFDLTESILTSSFDWNGYRPPMIVATENDSKNAIGMLVAHLLTGAPQLFADIRTNWTPQSIKKATGADIKRIAPEGFIDKRNSGAGSLDFALDYFKLVKDGSRKSIQEITAAIRSSHAVQDKLIKQAIAGTHYMSAILEYFPGDGLSSHYRTPGDIPMTAYRYSLVDNRLSCSIIEGKTIALPKKVADHVSEVTNPTWPETYWIPRGMSSFEYMSRMNPNHDANSFGYIGADMVTLNAMLRIPIDFHNLPANDTFRPTMWDRYNGNDEQVCRDLGPLYV